MNIDELRIGSRVRTSVAWVSVPQWSTGTVIEQYQLAGHKGVTIQWDHEQNLKDGFSDVEVQKFLLWEREPIPSQTSGGASASTGLGWRKSDV